MKEPGPYAEILRKWVSHQHNAVIIRFRPMLPRKFGVTQNPYQLTPEEKSRLLVESFEAFAIARDDEGVNVLLQAIVNGNQKTKYVLAGLLIRATQ